MRPSNEKNQHGMSINGSEKMCLHSDCWRDVPPRNSKEVARRQVTGSVYRERERETEKGKQAV